MKQRAVVVGLRADRDIRKIGAYIAGASGQITAGAYVARLQDFALRLDLASERGTSRDDICPGLRIIPFENSANLAILAEDNTAVLMRVFYRGKNWERELRAQFRRR